MNNVYQLHSNEQRIEQASEWIAKIDRGLIQSEKVEFESWLATDRENWTMLMKLAKMWDKMDALSQLSEVFPHTPQRSSWSYKSKLALAASILFVSAISFHFLQTDIFIDKVQQQVVSQNVYTTTLGEQATFYLQDKTKVVLNTDSVLKVTYTDRQRLFELEKGELHVTVAHNKALPLSVYAGQKVIQAVGTAFNVELKSDHVELIVTDGKVLVADQNRQSNDRLAVYNIRLPIRSLAVSQHQKVELGTGNEKVQAVELSEIEASLSWQQGNLIFRGETLQQAMAEVSRYSDYRFEFIDDTVKNMQIAGLFKTNDLDGLLAGLEQNFKVSHQRIGSNTIRLKLNQHVQ